MAKGERSNSFFDYVFAAAIVGGLVRYFSGESPPSSAPGGQAKVARLPDEQIAEVGAKVTLGHAYWACQTWETYEQITAALVRVNEYGKHLLGQQIVAGDCTLLTKGTNVVVTEQAITAVRWRRADDKAFRRFWVSKGTFKDD